MQRKSSWCSTFYCIRKPGENQAWKSIPSEFSSGNLIKWWKIEQSDLLYSHNTLADSLLRTIRWIHTPKQNQKCCWNPDHSSSTVRTIKCERSKTNPQKIQRKTATKNVYVFHIANICIHGEESHGKHTFHLNTEDLSMKQMFDISGKLKLGWIFMETFLVWWWRSHQSLAHKKMCFQILDFAEEKLREPKIQHCIGK